MKEYIYLIVPFVVLIINQIIKFTIESIRCKRLRFSRLFNGSGGMPSTHTAFIFSLITCIGIKIGTTTPMFALSFIVGLIVAYDSMGVRNESGKQAIAINKIVDELETSNLHIELQELKEQIGHQPLEVIVGILTGITFASLIIFCFF